MESAAARHSEPPEPAESTETTEARLSEVLERLGGRVAPLTLARERIIPVVEPLRGLFVEEGIIRGQVVSCQGTAATSIAFALIGAAMGEGAWLAVVDVEGFGLDAAAELGLPLERVVRIETETEWVEVVGAAVDGFDLVLTRPPSSRDGCRPASVRKLMSRLQQRGAVVITLGDTGVLPADLALSSTGSSWFGLGRGAGHLQRRLVDVEASGRRQPGVRSCSVEFAGGRHGVDLTVAAAAADVGADLDPQEQVLREMCSELASRDAEAGDVGADGDVVAVAGDDHLGHLDHLAAG